MYKKLSFLIFFSFLFFSITVVGQEDTNNMHSKTSDNNLNRLVELRARLSGEDKGSIRESIIKMRENIEKKVKAEEEKRLKNHQENMVTRKARIKKISAMDKKRNAMERKVNNRRVRYLDSERNSIKFFIMTREKDFKSGVINKKTNRKNFKNYIPISFDIYEVTSALKNGYINSFSIVLPSGEVEVFKVDEKSDIGLRINPYYVEITMNLKNEDNNRFIFYGGSNWGFEGKIITNNAENVVEINEKGEGYIFDFDDSGYIASVDKSLKSNFAFTLSKYLSIERSQNFKSKKEKLLEKDNSENLKTVDFLENVKEETIDWDVDKALGRAFYDVEKIHNFKSIRVNINELEKALFQKKIKKIKVSENHFGEDVFYIKDLKDINIFFDEDSVSIGLKAKSGKGGELVFTGNSLRGYKGYLKSENFKGIYFIDLDKHGFGYIYNIYPEVEYYSDVGYDAEGYIPRADLERRRKEAEEAKERAKEKELEKRVNYPEFWGEKPPENEFETYKSIYPFYIARIKYQPVVNFKEEYLALPELLVEGVSENAPNVESIKVDVIKKINEFNLSMESINKEANNLKIKNKINEVSKKIELHNKYIIELNNDKFFFDKKEFYEKYSSLVFLKDRFKHWLRVNEIKNKKTDSFLLYLTKIERKFERVIDSMHEVKLFKKISDDEVFSFDKYMKEKNIKRNEGRIRGACLENEGEAFWYRIVNPLEVTPVEFNIKDVIAYENLNSFTKVLVEFKNYKEYFFLKDIEDKGNGLLRYDFKQINGSDYFHFLIQDGEFIINDYSFFIFENFPESNKVRNKGEEYYKVVFRNNKGYIYNKEIKDYGFSCKGPFNFID